MPPVGLLLHGVNFTDLFIALNGKHFDTLAAAKAAGAPTLNYGLFLNNVINFLIVAFCVFILVQQVNRWMKKPEPAAAPTTKECPQCAMTIPIKARKCPHCTTQIG
jgi:large conductance mechanosensitive channel